MSVLRCVEQSPRWPADAIIVTGDLVQDESRAGYEHLRAALEVYGIPVLCIPGNHDDPKLMSEILSRPPFLSSGEYRLGSWSLVLLSTFLIGEDAGGLGPARLRGLDIALSQNGDQHVLVCMHHHPLPMGSRWLDGVGLRDSAAFLDIIDAHPNVRGVICGHVHQESDQIRNAIRFMSAPSTCAQFLPRSEFFALDNRPPGLRWLTLEDTGEIDTQVWWVDEETGR